MSAHPMIEVRRPTPRELTANGCRCQNCDRPEEPPRVRLVVVAGSVLCAPCMQAALRQLKRAAQARAAGAPAQLTLEL